MNSENTGKSGQINKIVAIVLGLVLVAGLAGWWIGQSDSPNNNQVNTTQSDSAPQSETSSSTGGTDVKSLVSYTLPDGWKQATCPSSAGSVFIAPNGAGSVNCNANPSSPVKISVDSANNKDCNQLQNVQNVSKHICSSEFINGKKSLRAETVYNKESSYKKETTINAYYIDTGKGVIKVEYIHDASNNEHQAGFEQLAKSVQAKS